MIATPVLLNALATPKLVEDMLARLGKLPAAKRRHIERMYKLSYYFGELVIATRETRRGTEVVAAGSMKEVAESLNRLPRKQAETALISSPDHIDVHIVGLPRAPRAVS